MKRLSTLMLVAYPFLTHVAVLYDRPRLEWLALLCLCCAPLLPALAAKKIGAWLLLPVLAVALYFLTETGGGLLALYLPSVVIPGVLMLVFGSTLRAGRVPLITQMAVRSPDPLTPAIAAYTRLWTQLWTGLFAAMALSAGLLALLGLKHWWSLATNLINYGVAAVFFAVEYFYRRWRFPERQRTGFIQYLRSVAQFDIRQA